MGRDGIKPVLIGRNTIGFAEKLFNNELKKINL
jgi:hypothetical protein